MNSIELPSKIDNEKYNSKNLETEKVISILKRNIQQLKIEEEKEKHLLLILIILLMIEKKLVILKMMKILVKTQQKNL